MKSELIVVDKAAIYNNGVMDFNIHVLNLEDGWYYVRYPNGLMSYINQKSNIKFIDNLNSQAFNFDNDPPII